MKTYGYDWIVKWGRLLGSYDHYIQSQCEMARDDGAPFNAIYKRSSSNSWATTSDIISESTRRELGLHMEGLTNGTATE